MIPSLGDIRADGESRCGAGMGRGGKAQLHGYNAQKINDFLCDSMFYMCNTYNNYEFSLCNIDFCREI